MVVAALISELLSSGSFVRTVLNSIRAYFENCLYYGRAPTAAVPNAVMSRATMQAMITTQKTAKPRRCHQRLPFPLELTAASQRRPNADILSRH